MKLPPNKPQFLGSDVSHLNWDDVKFVIIQAPLEKTVSYGKGTSRAPHAIIKASAYIELFDEELEIETPDTKVYTLSPLDFMNLSLEDSLKTIEDTSLNVMEEKKFPILIGGEHSVSIAFARAIKKIYDNFHVVHLDAHADMRDEYEGNICSHACAMRRIVEMGLDHTSIGIRSLSREEFDFIKPKRKNYIFANEIVEDPSWIDRAIDTIPDIPVFLTLDVDVFDSALLPHTGTPEPGGLAWYDVITFLKRLVQERKVVAADFVELAPSDESKASDFMIAKLIYKFINYLWFYKLGRC